MESSIGYNKYLRVSPSSDTKNNHKAAINIFILQENIDRSNIIMDRNYFAGSQKYYIITWIKFL